LREISGRNAIVEALIAQGAKFISLAEYLYAPILTTISGKGAVPYDHPLHAGVAAVAGYSSPFFSKITKISDVMIAVGCRFDDIGTGFWSLRMLDTLSL
jgi:acetolactate synthase-1/2/3 large subunit